MADTKKYKIIIEGINESIEGVGTLQDSLDKLGKKVEESGKTMKTASSSMDELAKTNQKIAEYNEEYATALAANKAVLADHNKEVKNKLDLEKAELTVQADLRDTYAQKQQLLTAMGKVIKNTAGDTSELQAKYAELNQELKDFDATLGNHQRNVGDYEIATKGLKVQLKEMQSEMANMLANGVDKADPKFVELAKKAGQLKDAIGDAGEEINRFASDTKKLDDVINIAQSATAAFTLYKGAMSAFGIETEGAVEAIQKLQGAMAVLQSLKQLQDSLEQNSATAKIFTKTMNMMTLGIQGTTTATKLLRVALMGIGIGIIIGLVSELVLHWEDLVGWFEKTFPVLNNLSVKIQSFGSALKKFMIDLPSQAADVLKKFFSGKFDEAISSAKKIMSDFKDNFWKSYNEGLTYKAAEEGIKRTKQEIAELEIQERNNKTHSKKLIELKKKEFEQRRILAKGNEEELNKIKLDEMKFFADVEDKKTKVREEAAKKRKKIAEDEAKKEKEILDAWLKAEKDGLNAAQEYKKKIDDEELKNKEKLAKAVRKSDEADYKIDKAALELAIQEAEKDEDKIKLKKKLIDLEAEHEKYLLKLSAMDELGVSEEEFDQMLSGVKVLTDYQAQVISNMQKGVEVINLGVEKQKKSTEPQKKKKEKRDDGNPFKDWYGEDEGGIGVDWDKVSEQIEQAYEAYAAPIVEGLGDSIHMMLEFAIEEAENALEEAEALHDEAVSKVEESKDRISEINDKMRESSGAQLEQYKQQMADEVLLLQQREQEEKRLQKEKEKREKELEKQKKKQRKLELQQQLIQAIVSGALAVVNGLATQPFMPVGIAMGALAGVATAIQIATITKQMSKLADGGLLQGRSHAQGGIAVGNTGIEVEGGEYVVNKRSTAKYLPLLQQINEEGARHKTVANQLGKMADGGQLNYERINSNMDALSTAKIVSSAIEGIEMHPVVSVVDINRGQRNYTEVRQLAGANS